MKCRKGVRPAERRSARGGPVASRHAGSRATTAALALAGLVLAPGALIAEQPSYTVAATTADKAKLLAAEDGAWSSASSIAWGPVPYETRFRALWSQAGLFLRYEVDDASPWHTMTREDEHLWEEEVVEIFIDLDRSGRDYYELEINPANVVCDLRMISAAPNQKGDIDWDLAGLETRVQERKGSGWTATAFLPWSGFGPLPSAKGLALPPKAGDKWRFNVFRIERPGGKANPEKDGVFAAWSPPSGKTFHDAGAFRDLVFAAPAR